MIEVSKVHYDVIAITEKKVQLNITQAVEGLGWEEEEDELAMKITFELYNAKYNGSRLSSLIKIGCVVAIKAYWGSGKGIVAMGNVTECERSTTKRTISTIIISAARHRPVLIFTSVLREKSGSITRTRKPVTVGP